MNNRTKVIVIVVLSVILSGEKTKKGKGNSLFPKLSTSPQAPVFVIEG